MAAFKLCPNIGMLFNDQPFLERFKAARDAGFHGVEVAFPYDQDKQLLQEALQASGLQQILINTEPGSCLGYAALEGQEDAFMASLKTSIEYCQSLKCQRLHLMCGKVGPDQPGSEQMLKRNLGKALPLLQEHGIVGLLEPINNISVPGYFLNDFHMAERIIREMDHPNLKLQLDLFHLQFISGNLSHHIRRLLPITGHIQIAQVPDRHEPNSSGEINYGYVFQLLQQLGYDQWVGLEYLPTSLGLSWIQEMGLSL